MADKQCISDWTPDQLKQYVDAMLDAHTRVQDERARRQDEALAVYIKAMDIWKEQANAFRKQIQDERASFFPKIGGYIALALTFASLILSLWNKIGV